MSSIAVARTREALYGRRVRLLTIMDEGNRDGLEIAMGVSLPSRSRGAHPNVVSDF